MLDIVNARHVTQLVVGLLLCLSLCAHEAIAQDQPHAFERADNLRKQAEDAYQRELAAPNERQLRRERIVKFDEAAEALSEYMKMYMKDKNGINYLSNLYVLGVLSEGASNLADAQEYYLECQKHPSIQSSEAVYLGKKISDLVQERLQLVGSQVRRPRGGGVFKGVVLAPM